MWVFSLIIILFTSLTTYKCTTHTLCNIDCRKIIVQIILLFPVNTIFDIWYAEMVTQLFSRCKKLLFCGSGKGVGNGGGVVEPSSLGPGEKER